MALEEHTSGDAAQWRRIDELQAEVLNLQQKLGDLHSGNYNSLRRAYTSLCQHVTALEEEARGMVAELGAFETQVLPAELVAQELGVAAAVAFGVSLLHTTVKALPLKGSGPVIIKGLWLLGGAYVLARLTGSGLAHMAIMFSRNAARKRRLKKQLEAVEERIQIMLALQQWTQQQGGPAAVAATGADVGPATEVPAAAAGHPEAGPAGGEEAEGAVAAPPRRISPATSSGSSAELVEMTEVEEMQVPGLHPNSGSVSASSTGGAQASAAPASSAAAAGGGGTEQQAARPAGGGSTDPGLQSLKAYVSLSKK